MKAETYSVMYVHKKVPWLEDYNIHWNYLSFEGKTILDLGADYGSTASFFFEKGATRVIAVESDKGNFDRLIGNYGDDPSVVAIHEHISSAQQIESLIKQHRPDIVKVDIEGAEVLFNRVARDTILSVKEYLIEVHSSSLCDQLRALLVDCGYKVDVRPYFHVFILVASLK